MCGGGFAPPATAPSTSGLRPRLGPSPEDVWGYSEGQRPSAHQAAEPRDGFQSHNSPSANSSLRSCARLCRRHLCQRVELVAICDVQDTVCRHCGGINRTTHVHLANYLLSFAFLHDHYVAILIAQVNFAIDQHWGTPHGREQIVGPVNLASLCIKRV